MAKKKWAFYPTSPITADQGQQLRVEIGALYVACSVTDQHHPLAFEFFELDNDINDWSDVFFEIKNNSQLLQQYTGTIDIRYNFKEALLVPMEKLSSAAADDYLTLIHGNVSGHEIKHDKIADQAGMITIYRIKNTIIDQAVRHFRLFQAQHIYTETIQQLLTRQDLPAHFLKIQVYPRSFVAVLMKERQLQMIQTFTFDNADDICFYLLSVLKEHEITAQDTELEMSGLIEPRGELHRKLQLLFAKRHFHNIPEELLLAGMLEENHPHTFTPFFNTAS